MTQAAHNRPPQHVPTVSVVMSVYNGERFLRIAIDSILNQTFCDFEFIIVNDGSTDGSLGIIKSYADTRIRLVNQSNHGLAYSLNKAIGISSGQFIARMDADDISLPSRLEKEITWLSKSKHRGLVSTYFSMIDYADGKPLGINLAFPPNHNDLRRALYITNPFPHGACMFRKEAIEDLGLYRNDYGPTEDYELWRRMAERWEVGLIPETLFWYRINNPGSISQKSNDEQNQFVEKIRNEQWAKPFIRKSPRETAKDLRRLEKQVGPDNIRLVESEYKSEQYALCKELLLRGKLKNAIIQFFGVLLIAPITALSLLSYLPRSFTLAMKLQLRRMKG